MNGERRQRAWDHMQRKADTEARIVAIVAVVLIALTMWAFSCTC